jgi:hypothetical protein
MISILTVSSLLLFMFVFDFVFFPQYSQNTQDSSSISRHTRHFSVMAHTHLTSPLWVGGLQTYRLTDSLTDEQQGENSEQK